MMDALLTDGIRLLLSHLVVDFVLQTDKMVAHKKAQKGKSMYLHIHALLAGVLAYMFLAKWEHWYIIPLIAGLHWLTDLWKLNQAKDNLPTFLVDQLLHILALVGLLGILHTDVIKNLNIADLWTGELAVHLSALILLTYPVGMVIGYFTKKWREELNTNDSSKSLQEAGRWIGNFERILIYLAIITGNFSAIGFLIGAKSLLRLNGMRNEVKMAEYILIGTLLSFLLSIIVGAGALLILQKINV